MLIRNEVELKEVLGGVQQTITWETMEPFVKQAELEYIVPAVSEAFYDELCDLDNPNVFQQKIIDRLKIASGYYALVAALPQLVVVIGDGGVAVNNQGGAAMYKWTYAELKNGSLAKADKALEAALVWLEKNQNAEVNVGVKVFQTWLNSDECTLSKSMLINDATELTEFFPNSNGSRRMYLSVRQYLKRVEKYDLVSKIGLSFFNKLKESSTDTKMIEAQQLAKYFVAHRGIAESLPFLNISEDFSLVSVDQYSLTEGKYALDAARRDALKVGVEENADKYLKKLMRFLDDNASATVFAEYFNSEEYKVSIASKAYFNPKNDPNKNYVRL